MKKKVILRASLLFYDNEHDQELLNKIRNFCEKSGKSFRTVVITALDEYLKDKDD